MSVNKKITRLMTVLIYFLLFLSLIKFFPYSINHEVVDKSEKELALNLKTANFWNLTGFPIYIDDTNPVNNWSKTAFANDWCRGNGSEDNPYIIENVTINSQGSGKCIEIVNSNVYFIIRNCTLHNSGFALGDAGIKLYNVDYGALINNTCYFNENGIYINSSSNYNNISGNTVYNNNGDGIYCDSGDNDLFDNIVHDNLDDGMEITGRDNIISGNRVYGNSDSGIYIPDINYNHYNNIVSNIVFNNDNSGIEVHGRNLNLNISGNSARNNSYGIYLGCYKSDVRIFDNNASYNTESGIYLLATNDSDVRIFDNNASYNSNSGIYLDATDDTEISGNIVCFNYDGIYLINSNKTIISYNNINNNTKLGLYFKNSNNNTINNNEVCYNGLYPYDPYDEDGCVGNEFSNNKCIPPPPPPPPPWIIFLIIILISLAGAILIVGTIIYRKKSSREKLISKSELSAQELEDLRKTESEVDIEKEHHVCLVHKGKIVGAIYLCPKCEAYYCMKCATVLKKKGEACWVCNKKIEL